MLGKEYGNRFLLRQYVRYLQAYHDDREQLPGHLLRVLRRENRVSRECTRILRLIPCLCLLWPLHFPLFLLLPMLLAAYCLIRRSQSHRVMDAILFFDRNCLQGQIDAAFRTQHQTNPPK